MEQLALAISLIAVLISAWALWRAERARATTLKAAWDVTRESRKPFWNSIEQAYMVFRADLGEGLPEDLHALIGATGMPPGVPVQAGHQIRNWAADNVGTLGSDERHLWSFVERVYLVRAPGKDTMDGSVIDPDLRESFDRARRKLSTFFLRQHQEFGNKKLFDVVGHAVDDAVLLAWLELALHRSTGDPGEGNSELYSFACFALERHAR